MKRILSLLWVVLALTPAATAQSIPLTDSAYASILTCGEGNEYYLSWGHSAIRICDTVQGIDVVYNYGTFDFDTPHFYWKFACGQLDYCLSRQSFDHFMWEYIYEGRAVWEQRLRLTHQELNNLFIMLEQNHLPEYRYYKYEFFRDNCATRVRDMVANCLVHRTLSPETTDSQALTYRDYLYQPTEENKLWWRLGVDIVLGRRCDHRCSNYEAMFSPIEMMHQFDTLTVSDTHQPVADPAVALLTDTRTPLSNSLSPTLIFYILFAVVLILTVLQLKCGWRMRWLDITLFSATTLVSLMILFLWFFTAHYCTKYNFNILWASPLFLYFAIRLQKSNRWVVWTQIILLLATVAITFIGIPQSFNIAVCPIALTLLVRLLMLRRA